MMFKIRIKKLNLHGNKDEAVPQINLKNRNMAAALYTSDNDPAAPLYQQWYDALSQDLSALLPVHRAMILGYMKKFLPAGTNAGYFDQNNRQTIMDNLAKIQHFDVTNENNVYAEIQGGTLRFNVTKFFREPIRMQQHIIFHELAHAITPTLGSQSVNIGRITLRPNRKITNLVDNQPTGIGNSAFLREMIAEHIACKCSDLGFQPQKTLVSGTAGVTSNWQTPNNRAYQAIGDQFLQTLPFLPNNLTDPDAAADARIDQLARLAMDPHNNIADQINDHYRSYGDLGLRDLSKIHQIFTDQVNSRTPWYLHRETVITLRNLLSGYQITPQTQDSTPELSPQ